MSAANKPRPNGAKVALNINKENKKYSPNNRIKKLPRTPNRIAGNKGEFAKSMQVFNLHKFNFFSDARPKLVKLASSLVVPGRDKLKALKKEL